MLLFVKTFNQLSNKGSPTVETGTDATIWTRIRPEAERLLADVAATGLVTGLLSNAPVALGAAIEAAAGTGGGEDGQRAIGPKHLE